MFSQVDATPLTPEDSKGFDAVMIALENTFG
jgi:hypothetical protein